MVGAEEPSGLDDVKTPCVDSEFFSVSPLDPFSCEQATGSEFPMRGLLTLGPPARDFYRRQLLELGI